MGKYTDRLRMINQDRKLTPEYIMPFGKHKGKPLRWVAQYEYNYLKWCLNNIQGFEVSKEVENIMTTAEAIDEDFNAHEHYFDIY